MNDENVKVEIKVCSYHWEEVCGMLALYVTDPPRKGEPLCQMEKRTKINPNIIGSFKFDKIKNLSYNYKERKE